MNHVHPGGWLGAIAAAIAKAEKTKTGEQVLRFVRIVGVGVLSAVLTHSPIDAVTITGLVEVAFRQVFPVQSSK